MQQILIEIAAQALSAALIALLAALSRRMVRRETAAL